MMCCQCRERPSVLSVYWDRDLRLCARCAHVVAFSRDHAQAEADHPPYFYRPDVWWDLWSDRMWPTRSDETDMETKHGDQETETAETAQSLEV